MRSRSRVAAITLSRGLFLVMLAGLLGCNSGAAPSSSASTQVAPQTTAISIMATTATTSGTGKPVPALVADGGRVFGMSGDYVLYVAGPDADTMSLFAYAISTGENRLLDDTVLFGMPYPWLSGDAVAVWAGMQEGRMSVFTQDLTQAEGRSVAAMIPTPPDVFLVERSDGVDLLLTEESTSTSRASLLNLYPLPAGDKVEVARVGTSGNIGFGADGYLQPDMDPEHIVWSAPGATSREIFSYDLTTGKTSQITDNAVMDFKPHVSGNLIAWLSGTEDNADVYVHDLPSGVTRLLGTGVQTNATYGGNGVQASPGGPQTDGRYVVWWKTPPQGSQILAYDSETGSTVNLSGESRADGGPQLTAGHVVWIRWTLEGDVSQIVARDLTSGVGEQVVAEGRVTDPMTNDTEVSWLEWVSTSGSSETWVARGIMLAPFPGE